MTATFLKEETKTHHDRLEQLMLTEKIFDKSLSREEYQKIIDVNYLVHCLVEPKIEESLSGKIKEELDFNSRRKIPHLQKDYIENLNEEAEISFTNEAQALGALYVLEGATLGGNVIRKQLSKNSQFTGLQFNYYGMYGERLGEKWRLFLQILEKYVPEIHKHDALSGALKTYQLFEHVAEKNI